MDKCFAESLKDHQAQIFVLIAGLEAVCSALPQALAAEALASLTRRAGELAETRSGRRDEAQLRALAPLLSALSEALLA